MVPFFTQDPGVAVFSRIISRPLSGPRNIGAMTLVKLMAVVCPVTRMVRSMFPEVTATVRTPVAATPPCGDAGADCQRYAIQPPIPTTTITASHFQDLLGGGVGRTGTGGTISGRFKGAEIGCDAADILMPQ
jgi:hypothetical protein